MNLGSLVETPFVYYDVRRLVCNMIKPDAENSQGLLLGIAFTLEKDEARVQQRIRDMGGVVPTAGQVNH